LVKIIVVCDKGNPEPDRRSGYPAISLVLLLTQTVPGLDAVSTQGDVDVGEVGAGPHDLCSGEFLLQPPESIGTPAGQLGTESKLGDGDKRDDSGPAFEQMPVSGGE